jgi:hypothetical protein
VQLGLDGYIIDTFSSDFDEFVDEFGIGIGIGIWRCPHRRLTLMRPFGNW